MSYCTIQDLIDRFGEAELIQLTDRQRTGIIDDGVVSRAISDATAEIDGYLAGRYTLPLETVPAALTRIACSIARYHLYDARATEQVSKNYDTALSFLRSVAKGNIAIGAGSVAPVPQVGGPQVSASSSVFNRDTLADY